MDTKDKLIGIAMILAGVAFIVLGSAFLVRNNNNVDVYGTGTQNGIYTEQQVQNNIYQDVE